MMPAPSPLPWAACQMPWTNSNSSVLTCVDGNKVFNPSPHGVMQFKGEFSGSIGINDHKHVAKRKASDNEIPK